MATIVVRDLDDDVRAQLKQRAARHNRSMEAEVRAILTGAVAEPELGVAWLAMAGGLRGGDLPIPPRVAAGPLDLS